MIITDPSVKPHDRLSFLTDEDLPEGVLSSLPTSDFIRLSVPGDLIYSSRPTMSFLNMERAPARGPVSLLVKAAQWLKG